jgi:hypothetical protein
VLLVRLSQVQVVLVALEVMARLPTVKVMAVGLVEQVATQAQGALVV